MLRRLTSHLRAAYIPASYTSGISISSTCLLRLLNTATVCRVCCDSAPCFLFSTMASTDQLARNTPDLIELVFISQCGEISNFNVQLTDSAALGSYIELLYCVFEYACSLTDNVSYNTKHTHTHQSPGPFSFG